jgi:quercetin dioxygenase-like cupin family protein
LSRVRGWRGVALALSAALVAVVLVGAGARARANATLETEEQRISRVLQDALVAHGGEVNRCFEKALADTLEVAGKVELAVDVGAGGRVTKTKPALDEVKSPVLLACLQQSAQTWTFAGIDPGSTIIVPLAFEGQAAQFTVKAADAPDHGPAGKAAPFSAKLLVDEATMRAQKASLTMLSVAPASRIALHQHPVAEVLYVLKGRARILSRVGTPPMTLAEGQAILLKQFHPHVIENMGRSAPAVMLQYFVPMGPERVYRDPKDAVGRSMFEVIRGDGNPAGKTGGMPAPLDFPIVTAAKVEPIVLPGGKSRVRMLFSPESAGVSNLYLGMLEADPGVEIPRHEHAGSAEILYVLQGGGELTIGSEKMPFGPEEAIHVPDGQPHAAKFAGPDKTIMLQLYAPPGPEAKFRKSGTLKGSPNPPPLVAPRASTPPATPGGPPGT